MTRKSFGLSIKVKLFFLLLTIPILVMLGYLYLTLRIFESDKIAYVFDANTKLAITTAAQVRSEMILAQLKANEFIQRNSTGWDWSSSAATRLKQNDEILTLVLVERQSDGRGLREIKHLTHSSHASSFDFYSNLKTFHLLAKSADQSSFGNLSNLAFQRTPEGLFWFCSKLDSQHYLIWLWEADKLSSIFGAQDGSQLTLVRSNWESALGTFSFSKPGRSIETPIQAFEENDSIISLAQIGNADLYAVVVTDRSTALKSSQVLIQKSTLFFIMFILLAIILSIIFARRMTGRLFKLEAATQGFSESNLDIQLDFKGSDEIDRLGQSFNTMAKNIRTLIHERNGRIQELKDTQEKLVQSEKLATVGEMAASISHEIHNPLSILSLSFDHLKDEIESSGQKPIEKSNEKISELIGNIGVSVGMLKKLSLSLKTYVRGRHAQTKKEKTSVTELLKETVEFMEPLTKSRFVNMVTDFKAQDKNILAQASMLQQVLINLIKNAVECFSEGQSTKVILLELNSYKNEVEIKVNDNGPGIPDEVKKKMFTPFFTTKPKGIGTGLGLNISSKIIADHGGSIRLDSKVGEGTTFTLTFPIYNEMEQPDEEGSSKTALQVSEIDTSEWRILYVEDEPISRSLVSGYFKKLKIEHRAVSNGDEALKIYKEFDPNIVITDYLMPGMKGSELAKRVRDFGNPYLKVILLSGSTDLTDDPNGKAFDAIFNKPFNGPVVLNEIARLRSQGSSMKLAS